MSIPACRLACLASLLTFILQLRTQPAAVRTDGSALSLYLHELTATTDTRAHSLIELSCRSNVCATDDGVEANAGNQMRVTKSQAAERAEAEAAAVFVELLELACDDGCSMSLNPKPEPQPEPEPEPESEPDSTPEPGPEPEPKPETVIQEDWKGFTPEPEQAKVEDDATNHLGIHLGTFDVIDEAPTDHHFIAQPAASGSTNRKMLKRVAQEWGQLQMGL